MDFDLTDAHKALRDKTREVCTRDIAPLAADIDGRPRFPRDTVARLAGLGLLGVAVPETFGGAGLDHLGCAIALEEVAAACPSTALIASAQNWLLCDPIVRFASDAQKQRWLPDLAKGEKLGCFAASEAGSTSDARGMATTAHREGDGWVIHGAKSFVTAGSAAQVALLFAATSPTGMSAFLIPTDAHGISFGPPYPRLGLRGALAASMSLDHVNVPTNALLGTDGQGQQVLRFAVEGNRIGAAALALGIARAAFTSATRYAVSHTRNGQPLVDHQTVQFMLADMSTHLDAARLLTWRAANRRDVGDAMGAQASMAKLVACQTATRVTADAVQVLGDDGGLAEYTVERCFRDAKVLEIYEGTNDFHRLGIASVLLKD